MAYAFKRKNIWYVRYKDESHEWQLKSCGKDAIRSDADYLAKEYSSRELNNHHKAAVRIIVSDLENALIQFRDTLLLRSVTRIDKQQSSINR